mmetsp:Transcript_23899/g.51115  ORF Transcript_23899/g.51115 Transcript_23899/m.51115 type:complete len:123 (+) Transcript_23899:338-706(+)
MIINPEEAEETTVTGSNRTGITEGGDTIMGAEVASMAVEEADNGIHARMTAGIREGRTGTIGMRAGTTTVGVMAPTKGSTTAGIVTINIVHRGVVVADRDGATEGRVNRISHPSAINCTFKA